MPRFSVSITDEQNAWVEQQAAERDRSKSEIIRHLIDVHRRAGEERTGAVNIADSAPGQGGDPAPDQGAAGGPSTRELAAQLERVTYRLDELEAAVTDTDDGTPSEAPDRDTAPAHRQDEPAGDDEHAADAMVQSTTDDRSSTAPAGGSTETTARSIPAPNEDGIIEAESQAPEDADGTAQAPTEGSGSSGTAQSTPAPDTDLDADPQGTSDADPRSETEQTWPTGDSHSDPTALEQTAYGDGEDATGSRDASAGGQAPGNEPGATAAADSVADATSDAAGTPPTDGNGPGRDQATEDGDLVYAAQDDAVGAETAADDDAVDVDTGASDDEVDERDGQQSGVDEDVVDTAGDAEGPFAGMTGDAAPEAVEAAIGEAIAEPALAESVFRCWEQLRDRGTAHRRIFKSHYEDTGDEYDSPDAWWRDVSNHFETLPGVEAPAGGGNFYRYRYNR